MQLSNEITKIFSNLNIQIKPTPKNISFLENVLKIYKTNTENEITKTVKAIEPLEKSRLEDIFRNTKNIENYYYFNNPITAKVVAIFDLKKIISKIKKPHSPFEFNEDIFIKYYCYCYKTLKEDDKKELFFRVDSGGDKVFVFFNSCIETINKDIFNI